MADIPSSQVSGFSKDIQSVFSNYNEFLQGNCHVFYKARRYGRWYVLKGLKEEFRGNALYEEWLYKEYSVGVSLDHPNVVRVESFEYDNVVGPCIVMEYLEGETLDKWLMHRQSTNDRRKVLNQLLDAVDHCHANNVYHQDLKPSNIMVCSDSNHVKLIDFGLSDGPQYAAFKHNSGTEGFAAPEQHDGKEVDQRADIYALGNLTKMILPHRYRRAIRKAMSVKPSRRQPTVDAFRRSLRSRWWIWVALSLVVVSLLVMAIIPSGRTYSVLLNSGQTVYFKVLQNFPHRKVKLVCPGQQTDPWPWSYDRLEGRMVIPENVVLNGLKYRIVEIDDNAFSGQFGLTEIVLPETIVRIGDAAFLACSGLKDELVIPRSLRSIGLDAFNDCSQLKSVLWQADSCDIEKSRERHNVFYRCSSLRQINVTPNVSHLPEALCCEADSLHIALISDGVIVIPKDFLAKSHLLDSIVFPNTLRVIEHGAFYECNFEEIRFPDAVEVISNYAFSYNNRLRHVVFGKSVRFIGNYAFADCKELESVTVRAAVPPEVQSTTFDGAPATTVLYVPAASLKDYSEHPVWGKFKKIVEI